VPDLALCSELAQTSINNYIVILIIFYYYSFPPNNLDFVFFPVSSIFVITITEYLTVDRLDIQTAVHFSCYRWQMHFWHILLQILHPWPSRVCKHFVQYAAPSGSSRLHSSM